MNSPAAHIATQDAGLRSKVTESLYEGERIVSSFGPYFATSRRVLLYMEDAKGFLVRELAYEALNDIRPVNEHNHLLLIAGAALMIVSFTSMTVLGFFLPLAGIALGVYFVLLGSAGRPAYYQIEADGVEAQDAWLWRIRHNGGGSFVATIRIILGKDPRGEPGNAG